MRTSLRYVFILVAFSCWYPAAAQETWEKESEGEIKDLEIQLTKERQLVLPRATRYYEKIPPRAYEPIVPAITYEVKRLPFSSPNFVPTIRPLRIKQEELKKLYGNYLSGGIGNYTSFMAEGSVSTKRDKKKLLGADFFWRSFGKGPVDGDNSASSNTRINLFGKAATESTTFDAEVNYANQRGYFYSYAPVTDVDRDKLKQVYDRVGARLVAENTRRGDFNYRAGLGYSHLTDELVSSEGELNAWLETDYQLKNSNRVLVRGDVFLINRKDSLYAQARSLVHVQPAYAFAPMDKLTVVAGLNLAFSNDYSGSLKIYPNVKARYKASEAVDFYATVTGDLDKVDLHSLSAENFWLNSNNLMVNTNRTLEFDGGLQASPGRKVAAKVGASFANLQNLYFYQAVRSPYDLAGNATGIAFDRFNLAYDNSTGRFNPYGELTYTESDKINATVRMDYYTYKTETLAEAWHRPTYRVMVNIHYNLFTKIYLSAGMNVQGGMKAAEPGTGTVRTLDTAVDINAKGRYFFSRQLSAFIQLDNVLSRQYPLYLGYPARGFQALAGVSWSL